MVNETNVANETQVANETIAANETSIPEPVQDSANTTNATKINDSKPVEDTGIDQAEQD